MVTLKDIAAEAGVSITTVSNVVHNRKSRVSEKKVAKIWEIIEREHYVPSMSARSLAATLLMKGSLTVLPVVRGVM